MNWFQNAATTNSALRANLHRRMPFLGLNILNKAGTFTDQTIKAISDPSIQELLFTAVMQFYGLGVRPEEMYKPGEFQKLIETPGYAGESIAAGAFQRKLGTPPPENILPKYKFMDFATALQKVATNPNLSVSDKEIGLKSIIRTYQNETNAFMDFLGIIL